MPWLLPSFAKKGKKKPKVFEDAAPPLNTTLPPINPTHYTFKKISKEGFRKSNKSLKTPVRRQGPYGGSKETSPVSGDPNNPPLNCTVSASLSLYSFNMQRETAILDSHESFDGTGKICLEKDVYDEDMPFGVTFEAVPDTLHKTINTDATAPLDCSKWGDLTTADSTEGGCSSSQNIYRVKSIEDNSVASNSTLLSPGDQLISINGQKSEVFQSCDELNEYVRKCEQKLEMEVKYHVPSKLPNKVNNNDNKNSISSNNCSVRVKSVELLLERDKFGYGIVVRGGFNEDTLKCRPIIVTYIRQNSPVDTDGTIRPGDRIVAVNGFDLSQSSVPEVNDLLIESGGQAMLTVEYDCSVIESVKNAQGALLVELGPTSYSRLGLSLSSFPSPRGGHVVFVDAIRPASVADRCGALHVGDQILSVNGMEVSGLPISQIISLIEMSSHNQQALMRTTKSVNEFGAVVRDNRNPQNSEFMTRIEILPSRYARRWNGVMSTSSTANSLVSAGRNGRPPGTPSHVSERRRDMHTAALSRSMYSSSSRSLPPPPQWQRNRLGCVGGANSTVGSIGSLVSNMSSLSLPFMISRSESTTVQINAQNHPSGFGFSLYSFESYPSEPLRTHPVIDYVEPEGPAQLTGLVHAGDRVVSVNDVSTLNLTLKAINQLLKENQGSVSLRTEFDVAETVVPSSGCFTVKLAKCGNRIGFRLYSSPYRRSGECLVILEVVPGSVAHRTGTISPGDRLLSINGISLANKAVEEAYNIMRSTKENVVTLSLEKDDEFSEHGPNAHNMYSVELRPNSGRLGITLSGSEEPFDPILIAAIESGSVADRIDVLHVNDQLVEICGCSLRGKTVKDAVSMLQRARGSVQLKILRKFDHSHSNQESGFSSMKSAQSESPQDDVLSQDSTVSSPNDTPRKRRVMDKLGELSQVHHGHGHLSNHTHLPEPIIVNGNLITPERLSNGNHDSSLLASTTPQKMSSHTSYSEKPKTNSTLSRINTMSSDKTRGSDSSNHESGSNGSSTTEVKRISLQKSAKYRDFGFSVSNGDGGSGIFINSIRQGGLAQSGGLLPMDKVLQINDMKLPENVVCENVVPLIANSGPRVDIVIERRVSKSTTSSINSRSPSNGKASPNELRKQRSASSPNNACSPNKANTDFTGSLKAAVPDYANSVSNQFYDKFHSSKPGHVK